jgi:hypothetical protein
MPLANPEPFPVIPELYTSVSCFRQAPNRQAELSGSLPASPASP